MPHSGGEIIDYRHQGSGLPLPPQGQGAQAGECQRYSTPYQAACRVDRRRVRVIAATKLVEAVAPAVVPIVESDPEHNGHGCEGQWRKVPSQPQVQLILRRRITTSSFAIS